MQRLEEKSQAGTLTENEERELDSYLHVGNLLAVMRSEARAVLCGSYRSECFEVSERDSLELSELLDYPPKPNAKLRAAARSLPKRK